ncbi:hypothetical protein ACPMJQ_34630 [Streptomyces pseudogriseolus]|uniref:hypothetical protein n=1 Tax=Streptomyces pseudogriseolus TaxID=36817 RepID=UPI003FA2EF4F
MDLWQQALLGAGGGLLVELVDFYNRVAAWRQARRAQASDVSHLFRDYFDVGPDFAVALTRAVLGAAAAAAFGAGKQAEGVAGLLAIGACAPVLLAQLGQLPAGPDVTSSGTAVPGNVDGDEAVAPPRARPAEPEGSAASGR